MYIKKLKELTTIQNIPLNDACCCLANVHKKIKRTHNHKFIVVGSLSSETFFVFFLCFYIFFNKNLNRTHNFVVQQNLNYESIQADQK